MLLLYGLEPNTNTGFLYLSHQFLRAARLLFIWCLTADIKMELGLGEVEQSWRGQSLTAGAPGCCWSDDGPLSFSPLSVGLMSETFLSPPRLSSLNILVFSCFITSIIDPWYCADLTKSFSQRLDKTCHLHSDGMNSNQPSDGADLIMHQCWVQGPPVAEAGRRGTRKCHRAPQLQLVLSGVSGPLSASYLNGRSLLCLSPTRGTDVTRN